MPYYNKAKKIGPCISKDKLMVYVLGLQSKKKIKSILSKLFLSSWKSFLIHDSSRPIKEKISSFVPLLARILPKCSNIIGIYRFIISQKDLQHILNSSLNWRELLFLNCKLNFENINITSKAKSNLQILNLTSWGCQENGNWKETPERFMNLMKAIGESGIKKSLIKINIYNCGITEEEARIILKSLEMENINVSA